MFGLGKKKEEEGRTVLLLDIESGSVGAALVRIAPQKRPRMFGERRVHLPAGAVRTAEGLARGVEGVITDVLQTIAEVAGRLRNVQVDLGQVRQTSIVLAAPWGRPNLASGRPDFLDDMTGFASGAVENTFGAVPVSLPTSAAAATYGARSVFGAEPSLVCVVGGEITELLVLDGRGVIAHATVPHGSHGLLRTLRAHGGYSEAEARSAARLPFESKHLKEPFSASAAHFAQQCKDAAGGLVSPGEYSRVRIVAGEPMGEWHARALAHDDTLTELFPRGEVRALRAGHLAPFVDARAQAPDVMLLLGTLFIDGQISR